MSYVQLNELKQKRGAAIVEMRAARERAEKAGRKLEGDDLAAWEKADSEQENLRAQIEDVEKAIAKDKKLEALESEMKLSRGSRAAADAGLLHRGGNEEEVEDGNKKTSPATLRAYNKFLADGREAQYSQEETRAMQADLVTAGGTLRPPMEFLSALIKTVDDTVFIRMLASKYTVESAESLGAPTLEANPADADWTAEIGAVASDTAMTFGKRELKPHMLTKLLKVSRKLLRVAASGPMGGAAGIVANRLAYKIAIALEKGYILGNGVNQPMGLFTASPDGIATAQDVQTGAVNNFLPDNIIAALYSIKEGYQRNASWLFHRTGLKLIRQLKDANNSYLWQPGLAGVGITGLNSAQGGTGGQILSRPVYMSEYVPNTFTTGLYVGIVGDFSYYWIADALTFELQRLEELYAGNSQVGFIARFESDGQPVLGEAFARLKTN